MTVWNWYIEQERELFLDLDRMKGKRLIALGARLSGALMDGELQAKDYFFLPSQGDGNLHGVIRLHAPMPVLEKEAWSLYLLGDRFRSACNLRRAAGGDPARSVLIEPEPCPFWREPDYVCECEKKHERGDLASCRVARRLNRKEGSYYFGLPRPDEWKAVLERGVRAGARL